ncbi:DUF58 domain-containing protein [Halorientalis sp.]|uniref:DUF58 domain-containing protein n=1 Tax=Halorientalis sp. TaxID=1931229 RepID=UPI002619328D|nr:DUF58 domain-containing protein [Halorientalis sp.]
MDPTRRFWQTVLSGGVLVCAALLFRRPLLLLGAAVVGAFVLALQSDFVRAVRELDQELRVEQTVTPPRVPVDEPAQVTLAVERSAPAATDLAARVDPPAGVTVTDTDRTRVRLEPGETTATTTVTAASPVAGRHTFPQPAVTVTGARAWFTETVARGPSATLTVDPRAPRNIHVGQGGDAVAARFGNHPSGQLGTGIEPAELREYEVGDTASQIDWKATARLNEPHVREFEAETDRTVSLVMDHRGSMEDGVPGETKLAYAREVALMILDRSSEAADPIGLYGVGDGGVTAAVQPGTTDDHYERVRRHLVDLRPTEQAARTTAGGRSPRAAREGADRLSDDDSAFAATLAPFFETSEQYVRRVSEDPLFGAVRSQTARRTENGWTMVFTDDRNRAEVLEAAKVARREATHVAVFLTPAVLFEANAVADLDGAYARYRDFESFRQRLARLDRVSAFEVGPGDRIAAILGTRTPRRGST